MCSDADVAPRRRSTTCPSSSGSYGYSGSAIGDDRDGQPVLEREAAVAGDVVGVRVGLEHALDPHALLLCGLEILLDRERGVDDDRDAGLCVTDQIRGAAEILVHELPEEQHGS